MASASLSHRKAELIERHHRLGVHCAGAVIALRERGEALFARETSLKLSSVK